MEERKQVRKEEREVQGKSLTKKRKSAPRTDIQTPFLKGAKIAVGNESLQRVWKQYLCLKGANKKSYNSQIHFPKINMGQLYMIEFPEINIQFNAKNKYRDRNTLNKNT